MDKERAKVIELKVERARDYARKVLEIVPEAREVFLAGSLANGAAKKKSLEDIGRTDIDLVVDLSAAVDDRALFEISERVAFFPEEVDLHWGFQCEEPFFRRRAVLVRKISRFLRENPQAYRGPIVLINARRAQVGKTEIVRIHRKAGVITIRMWFEGYRIASVEEGRLLDAEGLKRAVG